MSLPAAYLVNLWTFPVMLKSPEEHKLFFFLLLLKGKIFHGAGTFYIKKKKSFMCVVSLSIF